MKVNKLAKVIRDITVAPIMALFMLIILFFENSSVYGNRINFILAIIFLTILPLLAYPCQKYIPKYKDKGREWQRSLAMIFAVGGYILGCITNFFMDAPREMWIIYGEYFISGIFIFFFNKVLKKKASGHASGVMGPIVLLVYFKINIIISGIIILLGVYWASLIMKRHTIYQLLGGTLIPIVAMFIINIL